MSPTLLADAERTSEYRVIPWSEIRTVKKLGAGAFGEVMLAEWNGVEVAVKLFRNLPRRPSTIISTRR
jgi:predicted Ser/Thr protein kinase